MSSSREVRRCAVLLAALLGSGAAQAQGAYAGIGRSATPAELAAWDIDVRPDFKGLPPGAGSVAQGMVLWEAKCASCHGVFGESNQTFSPLVGGTTAADVKSGHAARLTDPAFPGRTTLMKLPTLSTLWDYIRRAMPWTQPKSLSNDEVYAVTAYLLNLGGIVPDDFTLSERNVGEVQQKLPNRNGMFSEHGLWPGRGLGHGARPDVRAAACMTNCAGEPVLASSLPDHARNAHGNLADQNRLVGAQRGIATATAAAATAAPAATAAALTRQHACVACHDTDRRVVGPSFREVAGKYAGRADAATYLAGKIRAGGSGLWGEVPMPPQALADADAQEIARWLAAGLPN